MGEAGLGRGRLSRGGEIRAPVSENLGRPAPAVARIIESVYGSAASWSEPAIIGWEIGAVIGGPGWLQPS